MKQKNLLTLVSIRYFAIAMKKTTNTKFRWSDEELGSRCWRNRESSFLKTQPWSREETLWIGKAFKTSEPIYLQCHNSSNKATTPSQTVPSTVQTYEAMGSILIQTTIDDLCLFLSICLSVCLCVCVCVYSVGSPSMCVLCVLPLLINKKSCFCPVT